MRVSLALFFSSVLYSQVIGLEPNRGAAPAKVKFFSRDTTGSWSGVYVTSQGVVLRNGLRLELVDGNAAPEMVGESPLPATYNYYLGSDAARWREGEKRVAAVRMRSVYPGIDAVWWPSGDQFGEVQLEVGTSALPSAIRFRVSNGRRVEIDERGGLDLGGPGVTRATVSAGQESGGPSVEFARIDDNTFSLRVGPYLSTGRLTVTIRFSNFNSGVGQLTPNRLYSRMVTMPRIAQQDFDGSDGAQLPNADHFVGQTDARGELVWGSILGGGLDEDASGGLSATLPDRYAIAITTRSGDFPVTANAPQPRLGSGVSSFGPPPADLALLALRRADGRLEASTYLGGLGEERPTAMLQDSAGGVVVTGTSSRGMPATPGAIAETPESAQGGGFAVRWDFSSSRFGYVASLARPAFSAVADASGNVYAVGVSSEAAGRDIVRSWNTSGAQVLSPFEVPNPADFAFRRKSIPSLLVGPDGDIAIRNVYGADSAVGSQVERIWLSLYATRERRFRFQRFTSELGSASVLRFGTNGSLEMVQAGSYVTSVTTTSAILTAACSEYYFVRFSRDGELLGASYLPVRPPPIMGPEFPDFDPLDPAGPAQVFCFSSTATRASAFGVSAGSFITITGGRFGPAAPLYAAPGTDGKYPLALGGIDVKIGGIPAPVIAIARGLVAVQVPFELPQGQGEATPIVTRVDGKELATLPMVISNPALSLFNVGGLDSEASLSPLAALNQDGSVNSRSNPAAAGSYVSLFATGLGPSADGTLTTGGLAPLDRIVPLEFPYRVNLAGASISFAGAAPGLTSGLVQINLRLPEDAPKGPVGISFGPITTPRPTPIPSPRAVIFVR